MDRPFWEAAEIPAALDEFVAYELFPDPADVEKASTVYGNGGKDFLSTYMNALRLAVMEKARLLSRDYLWHNEAFSLSLFKARTGRVPSLKGTVVFGDGLEDEWFVTHLLMQISKEFPELLIRLWDSDGEFLLIEAAEHLPSWLEPDTSANRVFVRSAKIHIISPSELASPKLEDSLAFIRRDPRRSAASAKVQCSIQERIRAFEGSGQPLHRHRLLVPRRLAAVLQVHPFLVSPLLQKLFNREPGDLASASSLSSLKHPDGTLDLVPVRVAFTRTQFAQLLCQAIAPPRGYPMPGEDSTDYLACTLGMKLGLAAQLLLLKGHQTMAPSALAVSDAEKDLLRLHFGVGETRDSGHAPSTPSSISELFAVFGDVSTYAGPDDDLSWLNVDGGQVINGINAKFQSIELSSRDQDEVVERMLAEEGELKESSDDDEAEFKDLERFINFQSGLEGVEYDGSAIAVPSQEDEERWDESLSDDEEESSEEFLHHEILEAIVHDPELLMKLLERGEEFGLDTGELLSRVQKTKEQMKRGETGAPIRPQKGIMDIDPAKVLAARARSRSTHLVHSAELGEQPVEESSSDNEDIDGLLYSKMQRPPKFSEEPASSSSSSNDGGETSMLDLMNAMDRELAFTAQDRSPTDPEEDLKQALAADKGPAHSIHLALHR